MEMDTDSSPEEKVNSPIFKTPFQMPCQSYMFEDCIISSFTSESNGTHSEVSQLSDSVPCDVSQLTDSSNDDFMEEAHLSVNLLKVSRTSEDSGVFSENGCDSLDIDFNCRTSEKRFQESFPSKRHASPIRVKSFKHMRSSPETPCETDIVRAGFSGAFQSTPLSPRPARSPKHRKCRNYSRDIFLKRSPCVEKVPSPYNASLVGQETVDILAHLGQHARLEPALDAILKCLNPEDLCRASIVSRSWKSIIENVPSSRSRKKAFLEQRLQIKENLHQLETKSNEGESLPFRGQLLSIQNFNRSADANHSTPRSPPVSPSKVRFNLFLKEGQKLEYGQALVPCPHCKLPSRRVTEIAALCTRQGCQYHFCVQCLCKFHGDKPCPVSVKHRKRQVAIGSRESRRNLQRLCH